jgi:glucokinase
MTDYAIGIDIGATYIRTVVSDEIGNLLKECKVEVPKKSITTFLDILSDTIKETAGNFEIGGIGIGSAGPIDLKKGIVSPTNLPLKNIPVVEHISKKFGVPVYLQNDCNAGAIGEKWYGAAKKSENFVYITLSTGIGGGVFVDGNLLKGKDGNAAEVGHFQIDIDERLPCGCGAKGHWEAYCSGRNIPNFARLWVRRENLEELEDPFIKKILSGVLTSKDLYESAESGNRIAYKFTREIGKINAMGISNVIDAYDPELIIIGGGLAENHKVLIMDPIKENVSKYTRNRMPEIKITQLRERAVIYGGIALGLKKDKY